MKDRVTILKRSETADSQGGRSTTWVDLITGSATLTRFSATVVAVGTREQLQAASVGGHLDYRVELRYRADITPAMRVSWRPYLSATTKTLEIHGAKPIDRGYVSLDCSEVI